MAGFGSSGYGTTSYGVGGLSSTPSNTPLLVQSSGVAGSDVTISGLGVDIVDTSLDDSFDLGIIDVLKWTKLSYGAQSLECTNGLDVSLYNNGAPASCTLISTDAYASADINLTYKIVSKYKSDVVTSKMTYAGLKYYVDLDNYIDVARVLMPGALGHIILASIYVGGVNVGGASIKASTGYGTLRIIKRGSLVHIMHNSDVLFVGKSIDMPSGSFRLYTATTDSNYLHTKFTNFKSASCVLFNGAVSTNTKYARSDKIICTLPYGIQGSVVDVVVFNHGGDVGIAGDAFNNVIASGTHLSSALGINATIDNDPILR